MMNRPYRKYGRPQLEIIFRENRDSLYVLNKVKHELESRETASYRKDVLKLYEDVLGALKELERATKMQPEDRELRLRLQEIDELRIQADGSGYFKWPTTYAPKGYGTLNASGWHEKGLFSHVGYHVGKDGEHLEVRRYILDCVFHNKLPSVNSDGYMREFAAPKSPQRLRKMADHLAAMARNYKRNEHADYSQAIADYESDLEYLYDKYYSGVFHFDRHPSDASYFDWPQI